MTCFWSQPQEAIQETGTSALASFFSLGVLPLGLHSFTLNQVIRIHPWFRSYKSIPSTPTHFVQLGKFNICSWLTFVCSNTTLDFPPEEVWPVGPQSTSCSLTEIEIDSRLVHMLLCYTCPSM